MESEIPTDAPILLHFKIIADNSLSLYREHCQAVLDELAKRQTTPEDADQELDTMQYEILIPWEKKLEFLPEVLKLKHDEETNSITMAIPLNRELFEFTKENLAEFLEFNSLVTTSTIDPKKTIFSLDPEQLCYYYIFSILMQEENFLRIIFEYFLEKPNQGLLVNLLLLSLNYNYQEGCIFFWDMLLMLILKTRELKEFPNKKFLERLIEAQDGGIIRVHDIESICLHKVIIFFEFL
jgi:hypothetical protein